MKKYVVNVIFKTISKCEICAENEEDAILAARSFTGAEEGETYMEDAYVSKVEDLVEDAYTNPDYHEADDADMSEFAGEVFKVALIMRKAISGDVHIGDAYGEIMEMFPNLVDDEIVSHNLESAVNSKDASCALKYANRLVYDAVYELVY